MSKRFTDTEKWFDSWFRELPNDYKLFWIYLCDRCNNAGVWKIDLALANFVMGTMVSLEKAADYFGDRIRVLRPGYWLIRAFVSFQFGDLSPQNRMHASVLALIQKEGAYKGLKWPSLRGQGQGIGKGQGKEGGMQGGEHRFLKPTPQEATAYAAKIGFKLDGEEFCAHYEARGWKYAHGVPMKNWQSAVVTWKKKADPSKLIHPPKVKAPDPKPEECVSHADVKELMNQMATAKRM